ncbi:MAG: FGGY family carbohydrate kinase [Pirellulales bacterium]
MRLDPYFSGTKVRWILDNVTGARARAEAGKLLFGTVDTWLLWQLTERRVHVTDATNASRTLLYNIHNGDWDDDMLKLLGIPRAMLPEVKSSSEVYGDRQRRGSTRRGAPIAGIAGDQQAALFGQACFTPGMVKNTYGTGCFLLMNTGEKAMPVAQQPPHHRGLAHRRQDGVRARRLGLHRRRGRAMAARRTATRARCAANSTELAASVPDAGGLFLVPAFAGLGAPHWDPYARGVAVGITRGTNRAHFCRAALEAIAFQSADLIACMEKDSGLALKELRVDGGASRSEPLMQFQADLLGTHGRAPEERRNHRDGRRLPRRPRGRFLAEPRRHHAQLGEADTNFKPARPAAEMQTLRAGLGRAPSSAPKAGSAPTRGPSSTSRREAATSALSLRSSRPATKRTWLPARSAASRSRNCWTDWAGRAAAQPLTNASAKRGIDEA